MISTVTNKIDISKALAKKDAKWVQSIREQALLMFKMHDGKLDNQFQYAIMAASFMYGTSTLAVVSQFHNESVSLWWMIILTTGVTAIIFAFAIQGAYTYQWFDYARRKLS
jgi:hypothetical protein